MTKILALRAENFKRLKAVDITPDPESNAVVIGGRNAQGKSSVLDAIMAAVAGKAGSKELVRPIRDGEKRATVTVELDDLVIERKWTPSGSTVTVSPRGGNAKLNSPQKVLDSLIGALAFDPLEFAEAEPRKQVETLIDIIGREQFDAIAAERRAAYDERTDVNRELKRYQAQYETVADASEPVEPVDAVAVLGTLEKVRRKGLLREQWQRLEDEINAARAVQATLAEAAQALPDGDLDELERQVREAQEINEQARAHKRWVELGMEVEDARHATEGLTTKITSLDERKATLIAEAPLPIEGLAFDEDGVTYNGVPFVQSSAAERLKVSVAMAMAMNPELRVICIRDASLLDDDSKAALVAMAAERDYQLWVEVVGEPDGVGVVIEDGEVKA